MCSYVLGSTGPKYKAGAPLGWVSSVLLDKFSQAARESVTGFNELLEEFISVILALLDVTQFNLIAFFLRVER